MTEKYPTGTRAESERLVREWGFRHIFTWTDGRYVQGCFFFLFFWGEMIHPNCGIRDFESPIANRSFIAERIYPCWPCPSATPIIPRTRIAAGQHTLSAVDLWQSRTLMIMWNCITGKLKRRRFALERGLMFLREKFMRFGLGMKGVSMWLESRKDATFVSTWYILINFYCFGNSLTNVLMTCRMSSADCFDLFDVFWSLVYASIILSYICQTM